MWVGCVVWIVMSNETLSARYTTCSMMLVCVCWRRVGRYSYSFGHGSRSDPSCDVGKKFTPTTIWLVLIFTADTV